MHEKSANIVLDKHNQQSMAIKVSIAGSIVLFLISAVVGVMVDSITLLLDASASLVILFVAFLMHVALKKLRRPPDDSFNFGYGKYEPLTVLAQGGMIIATCLVSIKFAIQDIVHVEEAHSYVLPTLAAFCSGVIGVFISIYFRKIAQRTNSQMLKAAGMHWKTDTVLSFGVCLGFLFGLIMQESGFYTITPYVDPVMAIILALIFIIPPVKIISMSALELLDAVPGEDVRSKVKKVVDQHRSSYLKVHRLRTRKAGEKIFVDICFTVDGNLTTKEGEVLVNNLERDLKGHFQNCDVIVYFRPALLS